MAEENQGGVEKTPDSDDKIKSWRLFGLAIAAIGAVVGGGFVGWPMFWAYRGAEEVTTRIWEISS